MSELFYFSYKEFFEISFKDAFYENIKSIVKLLLLLKLLPLNRDLLLFYEIKLD